jgi:hypothetical protein
LALVGADAMAEDRGEVMAMRRTTALVLGAAAVASYARARRWFVGWGSDAHEQTAALPGDGLVADATMVTTRAITIDAPPDDVWPWIVQMGQDRGGFYSYDWLENLFGLHIRNADRVEPRWQHLAVGDQLRAAPADAGPAAGFTVVSIDPGRSLVTAVGDPAVVLPPATAGSLPDGGTWAFVLQPVGTTRTRLIVRLRTRFALPPPASWVVERLLEPVHFAMERKQLIGIRDRAARSPAPADAPVASRVG